MWNDPFVDHYKVLGVKPEASQADIKAAYRKLAKKWHPDVNSAASAAQRFQAINDSFSVLNDAPTRAQFDSMRDMRFGRAASFADDVYYRQNLSNRASRFHPRREGHNQARLSNESQSN